MPKHLCAKMSTQALPTYDYKKKKIKRYHYHVSTSEYKLERGWRWEAQGHQPLPCSYSVGKKQMLQIQLPADTCRKQQVVVQLTTTETWIESPALGSSLTATVGFGDMPLSVSQIFSLKVK